MKEGKNKKGLFHLFSGSKFFHDSAEAAEPENVETPEENVEEVLEKAEETTAGSDTSVPIETGQRIWEGVNDPLIVQIDESELRSEANVFQTKMASLASILKRSAQAEQEAAPGEGESGEEKKEEDTVKIAVAVPKICVSKNRMAAWIYVIPPMGDGRDIALDDLKGCLAQSRVTCGILEDALNKIVEEKIYDKVVLVARGKLAVNGVNGSITDHFKRVVELQFDEDEKGNVDYKNLNNIQGVKAGEVICDIIPSIPGQDGQTVTGEPYPCVIKGKDAVVPSGRNTVLSEDKTQLLSQLTGHLIFKNEKFHVESLLKVEGDVGINTGNLDYDGDILVEGDVRNGYAIKATGLIQIKGSVEGAQIVSGGSVTITNGMSGNGRGSITATGDVKCRYLEHCTILSGGSVFAESIINSTIESDKDVIVTSGMGVIIGGTIMAAHSIECHIIGSKARRHITEIVLGNVPHQMTEGTELEKELAQLRKNLTEIGKNIIYLRKLAKPEKQALLDQLIQADDSLKEREIEIMKRLNELADEAARVQAGRIQCRQLFPVVRVRIGPAVTAIQEENSRCVIYKSEDGEVVLGTY